MREALDTQTYNGDAIDNDALTRINNRLRTGAEQFARLSIQLTKTAKKRGQRKAPASEAERLVMISDDIRALTAAVHSLVDVARYAVSFAPYIRFDLSAQPSRYENVTDSFDHRLAYLQFPTMFCRNNGLHYLL